MQLCTFDDIDSIRLTTFSLVIRFHSRTRATSRSAIVNGGFWSSRRSIRVHKCSLGLRSGLRGFQGSSWVWFLSNQLNESSDLWQVALSCWKSYWLSGRINSSTDGSNESFSTLMYRGVSKWPRNVEHTPVPSCPIHPQKPIEPPPPCTTLGMKRSSYYSFL